MCRREYDIKRRHTGNQHNVEDWKYKCLNHNVVTKWQLYLMKFNNGIILRFTYGSM
jgi:hypothetical protein